MNADRFKYKEITDIIFRSFYEAYKVSKPLQRFSRLFNCERVVQVVQSEGIYRQVKIDDVVVTPVKTGVQMICNYLKRLDSANASLRVTTCPAEVYPALDAGPE